MSGEQQEYWFCVKHHRVETVGDLCPSRHRLGPYPTSVEAERALQTTQERNEAWESDPDWNDEVSSPDDPPREG